MTFYLIIRMSYLIISMPYLIMMYFLVIIRLRVYSGPTLLDAMFFFISKYSELDQSLVIQTVPQERISGNILV